MIDPRGLTIQQYFDGLLLAVPDVWAFGALQDPDKWQDYAVGFVRAPSMAQRALPDPYQFSDWRGWAMRVYPMLEGTV